jgi:hypothetical protein
MEDIRLAGLSTTKTLMIRGEGSGTIGAMAQGPSPLLGYNTNVRHKGKLYHIQTEDSGVNHPHIITHLFADGGRIIASKKTSYASSIGVDDLKAAVKKLMQEQHKGMFISLRDGIYDTDVPSTPPSAAKASVRPPEPPRHVDLIALDRAAAHFSKPTAAAFPSASAPTERASRSRPPESIFGGDLLSEKSLDEVILSYLASDLDEAEK